MWSPSLLVSSAVALELVLAAFQAPTVPTDVQLPGTQPLEVSALETPDKCDNCHGGYNAAVEPAHNWRGSPMAHASRDPLFWATVAIAEQDFDGVGDLCIRCHVADGWIAGRSTPTEGSGLQTADATGVACDLCHALTDPDGSEHQGTQLAPFVANDGGSPAQGYYGSSMFVLLGGSTKLGPYGDINPPHAFLQSDFHRSSESCGTCHDVSNSVTGDLAHNHGAPLPLAAGTYSGVPGAPVDQKAAFNNFPFAYGVVERTFSEHMASAFPTLRIADYANLPGELKQGAIEEAWSYAKASTASGDYADGTPRYFSCQTCHMHPVTGKGCNKASAPVRTDLPLHDMTGGNAWIADAIQYLSGQGKLLFGAVSAGESAALAAGKARALHNLGEAAALQVTGDNLRVVNLTGHKLLSGYPEGRRMWLGVKWYDGHGALVREDGAYGTLDVVVEGQPVQVQTLLAPQDPHTYVWQAKLGLTQEWAGQLLALGLPASLALEFDRVTGAVAHTLGQLAAQPPGTVWESFHFALNNTVIADNRIPPYGFRYDDARLRNARPVPETQFGDPGAGGVYQHYVDVPLDPPSAAASATITLYYQPTSWEYVQFLLLANDGSQTFLAQQGDFLYEAWRNTGMAPPVAMASTTWQAPCEPDLQSLCAPKLDSAGCAPALSTSGWPLLSGDDDFHVVASDVLGGTTGRLLWSRFANPPQGFAGAWAPIGASPRGGTLCVFQPRLFGLAASGGTSGLCDGVLDFHLTEAFFSAQGLGPGDDVHVQVWYADPTHPDGSGLGHTDALRFTLCP